MGDYIFYETATGRVAKRDFKTPAELRAAIAAETDPDDAAEMQARLDRRMEHVSMTGRATVRGVNWIQRRLNTLMSLADSVVEGAVGVEEGEMARQRERITRERQLVEATLQTQRQLRERFEAQEVADRIKEAEARRREAAERKARISTLRSRRRSRSSSDS